MISERFLMSAKEKDMWQVYGYNLQHVKLKPTNNSNKVKIITKFDVADPLLWPTIPKNCTIIQKLPCFLHESSEIFLICSAILF